MTYDNAIAIYQSRTYLAAENAAKNSGDDNNIGKHRRIGLEVKALPASK